MADRYTAARMLKPLHFRIAPLKRGRGEREVVIIGFDSEQDTTTGAPMLFQFSESGGTDNVDLRIVPDRQGAGFDTFMRWIDEHCHGKKTEYIVFGFNLQYEWTQLYGDLPDDIGSEDEFVLNVEHHPTGGRVPVQYQVTVANKSRYFATILNTKTHRRVRLIDAAAFWDKLSLDKAAAALNIGHKIQMGSKKFTRADLTNAHFLEYARQDAWLTRRLGEVIIDLHETFDVATCITAPHFASTVFRKVFLSTEVPLAGPEMEQEGLLAYHGGKNGYYLDGPRHLSNVYAYDITSAYPEAMRQLPNLQSAEWQYSQEYVPGAHAIWNVTAQYRSCQYRGIMQHDNSWHETGEIVNARTTSYELDTAIALGELDVIACEGWMMVGDDGGPLQEYVDTFFEMKETATRTDDKPKRNAAKLFLNSLYGKFFQKVPLGSVGWYDLRGDETGVEGVESVKYVETDPTQEFDYQAGGLYHPPIAAMITGFVRAKIHRLEHKYEAIMTSTDGFFARRKPDPSDIGTALGMLTVEKGDLSIWRERLYHFTPHRGRSWGLFKERKSPDKNALHGFRGTLKELMRIPLSFGTYGYTATQVMTNKMALKTLRGAKYRAGQFVEGVEFTLDLSNSHAPP